MSAGDLGVLANGADVSGVRTDHTDGAYSEPVRSAVLPQVLAHNGHQWTRNPSRDACGHIRITSTFATDGCGMTRVKCVCGHEWKTVSQRSESFGGKTT